MATSATTTAPLPEFLSEPGWEIHDTTSPFTAPHGRMYQKFDADGVCWRAFEAREEHCNGAGIIHGGMLMTFADALMGLTVAHNARSTALTVRMTTDLLSIARPGDWVVGNAKVSKLTRSVAFVGAEAHVGKRPLLACQGLFKLMRRRELKNRSQK